MKLFELFQNQEKLTHPVFYKEKTPSTQVAELEKLLKKSLPPKTREEIQQDIQNCKAGDAGEKQVRYILSTSYQPMYILHDVYFKEKDLSVQIDFLIITKKHILILECKNYSKDVQIDSSGQFILTGKDGTKEGIPTPVEQNRRHLDFLCQMFPEYKKRFLPVVVFSNAQSILNKKNAPEEIASQVCRADQLVQFIRETEETHRFSSFSDKEMERLAEMFNKKSQINTTDYTAKYQQYLPKTNAPAPKLKSSPTLAVRKPAEPVQKTKFLLCPKCKKPVRKSGFGWYCTGKCGMILDKVYGVTLSDEQVESLLQGKSVVCQTKKRTTVLPEAVETFTKDGKKYIQWKTK